MYSGTFWHVKCFHRCVLVSGPTCAQTERLHWSPRGSRACKPSHAWLKCGSRAVWGNRGAWDTRGGESGSSPPPEDAMLPVSSSVTHATHINDLMGRHLSSKSICKQLPLYISLFWSFLPVIPLRNSVVLPLSSQHSFERETQNELFFFIRVCFTFFLTPRSISLHYLPRHKSQRLLWWRPRPQLLCRKLNGSPRCIMTVEHWEGSQNTGASCALWCRVWQWHSFTWKSLRNFFKHSGATNKDPSIYPSSCLSYCWVKAGQ